MKSFISILILFGCLRSFGAPVPHAVLNQAMDAVVGTIMEEAALVNAYRSGPNSNKVARIRLIVVPPLPSITLQQKVMHGGWTISPTNAVKVWTVTNLTPQEVADANAKTADAMAAKLWDLSREGDWALQSMRIDVLQVEIIGLLAKAIQGANLQTNLTAQERNRFLALKDDLAGLRALWNAAKTFRDNLATNLIVADPAGFSWPTNRISE